MPNLISKECRKCKRCNNQRKDYLNKFQICNSCCKQMEQITPSGFMLNFKFKECIRCHDQRRDCLNEFQICNSCSHQMKQTTPVGFKPNFKFEECKRCYNQRNYLNEFMVCNSCYEQITLSGNNAIDDFLRYTQTNYN